MKIIFIIHFLGNLNTNFDNKKAIFHYELAYELKSKAKSLNKLL
jgi:hypothetical protein